jgi:hypothetical protein
MAKRHMASFDHQSDIVTSGKKVPPALNYQEIETQLRRLEYRLIILSLIQGQGRPYLNRMERMQYQDICQQLNSAVEMQGSAQPARRGGKTKAEIEKWLTRFRGALSSLDKEPCNLDAQHDLQETGKQLIPLFRQEMVTG